MEDKMIRPSDIQIKPAASGGTETRGLQGLPSMLLSQIEAQGGAQVQATATQQQGSSQSTSSTEGSGNEAAGTKE